MKRRAIIFVFCCAICNCLFAQQPPAQLPSLIDDATLQSSTNNDATLAFLRKNIFVKAFAGKDEVYAGEPVLVTYQLFASMFCRSRVSRQPEFSSCSILEMNAGNDPDIQTIDGKKFEVYTIRKVQVTPLAEGDLHLGAVEVENTVQLYDEESDLENYSFKSINTPLVLHVLALPAAGRPKNFSGVVGSFSMETSVDSNNLPAGENANLKITIKGSGNFAGIHLPIIQWPAGTEHFEAVDTQHLNQYNYPVTGYKTFLVPFIGSKEGNVEIGPASFNFFDPVLKIYRTVTSSNVKVKFTKALSSKDEIKNIVTEDASNDRYLWIVGAIASLVICVWVINIQIKTNKKPEAEKKPIAEVKETLPVDDATEKLAVLNSLGAIDDEKRFLAGATDLLISCLQLKLVCRGGDADTLIKALQNDLNDTELARMCSNIFSDCNRNLYAAAAEEGIKEKVYFELGAVIKRLYPSA